MENKTTVGAGPERVVRVLAGAPTAVTIAELVERTGLHENTLRTHLDTLLAAGRITRLPVRSGGRGRPRWGYVVRPDEYAGLAQALVDGLAGVGEEDRDRAALEGGRAWGRRVAADLDLPGAASSARSRVHAVLQHTGFAPEDAAEQAEGGVAGSEAPIRLIRCPILDSARRAPEVVCRVHQGMLEGALAAGAPAGEVPAGAPGVRLRPFAEPGCCWVQLAP